MPPLTRFHPICLYNIFSGPVSMLAELMVCFHVACDHVRLEYSNLKSVVAEGEISLVSSFIDQQKLRSLLYLISLHY